MIFNGKNLENILCMNNIYPLVSVVIPCFNAVNHIDKCLDSISNQTYPNIELIIIDDGSFDGTGELISAKSSQFHQLKLHRMPHQGVSKARNTGVGISTGEFILFVDSDDYILSDAIEKLMDSFDDDIEMVFFEASILETEGVKLKNRKIAEGRPGHFYNKKISSHVFFTDSIKMNQYIESPCMYIARKSLIKELSFAEGYIYEDSLYLTNLLLSRKFIVYSISDRLYCRLANPFSITHKKPSYLNFKSCLYIYSCLLVNMKNIDDQCLKSNLKKFSYHFLARALNISSSIEISLMDRINLYKLILTSGVIISKYREKIFSLI